MKERDVVLDQKIKLFLNMKQLIHVKLKTDTFYNGTIEEISDDFFMLKDRKIGLVPVFLLEIERIEPFKESWR
jgi:hypothetical protein